jgi:hypothetical protein
MPAATFRRKRPVDHERDDARPAASVVDVDGPLEPDAAVDAYLEALDRGAPWYPALLDVIAHWTAADEQVEGIPRPYLIAGEAFDWLRLAERLIDAAGERVPTDEAERLLFRGEPPDGSDEDAFARAIGPQKHRAHLNFQYGVVIEETLLLVAELELHKARTIEGVHGEPPDVLAYERVYGKPLSELLTLYRNETGAVIGQHVRQCDWQAFTYWCSKYRFKTGEPARVASDTRKALALLSRLHAERARPAPLPPDNFIDSDFAYDDEDE